MAGLLYKDWLLLRRQLWYYALLLGLYLALTAAGVLDASFLCGLAVLYGTLLPTTCFSYDEAVHWERYAAATLTGNIGELPHVADADGTARGKQDEAQAGLQGFSFHDSINSLFPICSAGRAHRAGQSVAFVL